MKSSLKSSFLLNNIKNTLTKRKYCSTSIKPLNEIEKEEIQIPVPWGHISCVRWGSKDAKPVIALHGWQDNAGTWNTLIPYLVPKLSILAVDNPGHGHSSWFPAGLFYHPMDELLTIRRTMTYFGLKSTTILGHSLGGVTAFSYAALFPKEVDSAIVIDVLNPVVGCTNIENLAKIFNSSLETDARNLRCNTPPTYPFDELVEKLYIGSDKSVDKDKCYHLLERAISKSPNDSDRYFFKRDPRIKLQFKFGLSLEDAKALTVRIKCPMLHIKYEMGPYYQTKKSYMEILEIIKRENKKFEMHLLPGNHHGHLNNPETVAPYINNFLEKNGIC